MICRTEMNMENEIKTPKYKCGIEINHQTITIPHSELQTADFCFDNTEVTYICDTESHKVRLLVHSKKQTIEICISMNKQID